MDKDWMKTVAKKNKRCYFLYAFQNLAAMEDMDFPCEISHCASCT